MGRLDGKVAVITGAGSGIGAAGAVLFAAEGARVVVADIAEEGGQATVQQIEDAGGQAVFVRSDVTSEDDSRAMVDAATTHFGALDIVWANAGLAHGEMAIEDTPLSVYDKVFAVNALGPWLTIRAAAPILKAARSGSVVITSSLSGVKGRPNKSAYQASKGAAVMLAHALAMEFAPFSVRVNSVAPVSTDTPMLPVFSEGAADPAARLAASANSLPLGRIATPRDIANAALFLASDDSALVTGTELFVDAGARA